MLTANYHTHTYRCGHAGDYPDEAYVQAAVQAGYKVLGMSDHTPWPYESDYTHPTVRMPIEQLDGYLASMAALRDAYRDKITMYIGMECEFFPRYLSFLQELREKTDYLILGNHFRESDELKGGYFGKSTTQEQLRQYVDYTVRGMETGLFCCLAHPDFVFSWYPVFDDACRQTSVELCRAAKALNIPVEYNLYGVEKIEEGKLPGLGYPVKEFWEIAAQEGCSAILGVDAHRPDHMLFPEREETAKAYLRSLGIQPLETLPGLE